jgi:hypothetical protein
MDATDSTTQSSPLRRGRWVLYLVVATCAVVGTVIAAGGVAAQVRLARYPRQLASASLKERRQAVEQISRDREARALPALIAMLDKEQDRELVGVAGNAVLRTRSPEGVDVLRRRGDLGPDDSVRADLIVAAARLSNRDVRLLEWLNEGAHSNEPWRAMASAIGLVELGRPEGGPLTLSLMRKARGDLRAWGLKTLARTAKPLTQAVGQPMAWVAETPEQATDAQLDQLAAFWSTQVDSGLLCAVLQRVNNIDPDWAEVGRLTHARDKVAKWLQ